MSRAVTAALLFIACCCQPLAAQKATERPDKLEVLRLSWLVAQERDVKPLFEKYLVALGKLQTELTKQGKLEAALFVRKELDELSKEGAAPPPVGEKKKGAPEEWKRLRKIYDDSVKTITDKNNAKYKKALLSLKRAYEKAADLDAAVAVKAELDRLPSANPLKRSPLLTDAVITSVKGGSRWKELKAGVDCVSNRPGRKWTKIPDELKGMSFSTYVVRETKPVTIEIEKGGIVRVAYMGTLLERLGWENTGLVITNNAREDYKVWQTVATKDIDLPKPGMTHGYVVLRKDQNK